MDKRKRLIELIRKSDILCDTCGENSSSYCAEALADYLLANGVIVPPCKEGDTVYVVIQNSVANETYIEPEKVRDVSVRGIYTSECNLWIWNEVGEDVFLTKEEAEQVLKERYYQKKE